MAVSGLLKPIMHIAIVAFGFARRKENIFSVRQKHFRIWHFRCEGVLLQSVQYAAVQYFVSIVRAAARLLLSVS
jgi:hypothetical protein